MPTSYLFSVNNQKGQSLVEVLVALSIAALVVIALVILVLSGLKNAQFAQSQTKATKLAQEGIEKVKVVRDRNGVINVTSSTNWGCSACNFDKVWSYQLSNATPCATRPSGITTNCYFKIDSDGQSLREAANEVLADGFTRQIIFTDSATSYTSEKTIKVQVAWQDSAGSHQSNLETILTNY